MLEFIPRRQFRERLAEGWRLIPGHEYNVSDWAILMGRPDDPEPLSLTRINLLVGRFAAKPVGRANRSAASTSRQITRGRDRLTRLLERA